MAIPGASQAGLPQPKQTEQQIKDRLTFCRELWMEWRDGTGNASLTRAEIWREMDRALDLYGDHLKAKP